MTTATAPTPVATVRSWRAGRDLLIGTAKRRTGSLVPEAVGWSTTHQMIHVGHLFEVFLTTAELEEAIAEFCPDEEQALIAAYGLSPQVLTKTTTKGKSNGRRKQPEAGQQGGPEDGSGQPGQLDAGAGDGAGLELDGEGRPGGE